MLLSSLDAVNELHDRPQWYNALTENATTTIRHLAGPDERRSWWSWKLILNGHLDGPGQQLFRQQRRELPDGVDDLR